LVKIVPADGIFGCRVESRTPARPAGNSTSRYTPAVSGGKGASSKVTSQPCHHPRMRTIQ
jgi:hypothetical protein